MITKYYALSVYLRQRFGERVQKIPLDAGLNCPNRDGAISKRGCIFCNPSGSGTGQASQGKSFEEQWRWWRERLAKRYKARRFLAYLQSFSNTYCSLEQFTVLLRQLSTLPQLNGICIGTRPDCLDADKLDLLQELPVPEIWLDLGLQSSNDRTLQRINRGHDAACFAAACRAAADRGIKVCAHLIAGLPDENTTDFLASIDFLNALPVHGVKFHNLYVCQNTPLATWTAKGAYIPLQQSQYCHWLGLAIAALRPDIVLHRLNGDPAPGELVAPLWAENKQTVLNAIHTFFNENGIWQGQNWLSEPPAWFCQDHPPPQSILAPHTAEATAKELLRGNTHYFD
ncbi:MAG: TIGR01212 family radical SAM protein [Thermodesulfobacteriota bacterium]